MGIVFKTVDALKCFPRHIFNSHKQRRI